jgi:hypothetical protein
MDTTNLSDAEVEALYNQSEPKAETPAEPIAAARSLQETPQDEDSKSALDYAADAAKGVAAGAESAVIGARTTVRAVGKAILPESFVTKYAPELNETLKPSMAQPTTVAGRAVADITQLAVGYAAGGGILKAAKVAVNPFTIGGSMAQSAVGTPLVADPDRERLSNMLEQYPFLKPAASLLAQDPTDSVLMSKAKAGLEDVLSTGAAGVVFKGLRLMYLKASGKGTPAEIQAAEADVLHSSKNPAGFSSNKSMPPEGEALGRKTAATVKAPNGDAVGILSPAEAAQFEESMSKLVAKDAAGTVEKVADGHELGRVNARYLDSNDTTLNTMAEMGKVLKPKLEASVPGYRSIDETKELASILGQDPVELTASLKAAREGLDDIDVVALGARQSLQTQSKAVYDEAQRALLSGDTEAFKQSYQKLAAFQSDLSAVGTSLGRGLRSFGEKVEPLDLKSLDDPQKVQDLMRLFTATEGDATQMARITKMQSLSTAEKIIGTHNEYWIGLGLLSKGTTQIVNVMSTAINTLMEPAAMFTGGVMRGMTGKGWSEAREAVGIYNGLRTSFFDSVKMSWNAFKTDHAILSPNTTLEEPTKFISSMAYNMNPDSMPGKFVDLMGNITRFSFRGLTAGDEFFKQISYRAKISATASREAVDMVKAGTLKQSEVASYVEKALQKSIDDAGAATNSTALQYAEKSTFTQDLKGSTWGDFASMGETVSQMSRNPILRGTILPFVKTPTNVMRTTFEYTPVIGQLRKQFYADVTKGGEAQASAIGKLTLGAGMYAGATMLALDGRITGAPKPKGVVMPAGWQPYSVVIRNDDGTTRYISYARLQPFGDILGLTADFMSLTGHLDDDTRNGVAHSMSLSMAAVAFSNSLISKTYLRGITEALSILGDYNSDKKVERWLQSKAASYVPGAVSQFNGDTTVREVRSMMDAIMSRVPGVSQSLPAKRDYFGQIRDTKMGLPWSVIQPLNTTTGKRDIVQDEMSRLSAANEGTKFRDIQPNQEIAGMKFDLREVKNQSGTTAFDRMAELMATVRPAGESLNFHDKMEAVMKGSRYQLGVSSPTLDGSPMFEGLRQAQLRAVEHDYRKAALDQVSREFKGALFPGDSRSLAEIQARTLVTKKKTRAGLADSLLNFAP